MWKRNFRYFWDDEIHTAQYATKSKCKKTTKLKNNKNEIKVKERKYDDGAGMLFHLFDFRTSD